MNDTCIYRIELRGEVDEGEVNALGPLRVKVEPCDTGLTLLTVHTDQSGLIGLLRYLHGLGFVVLTLSRMSVLDGDLAV